MAPNLDHSLRLTRTRPTALRLFLSTLACMLLAAAAQGQVTFTGLQPSVNLGSQAIGSLSGATAVTFSIAANTTVGSIAVLTTGAAGRDFGQAAGSTCAAGTAAATTACNVNINFKPLAAGLRLGAVVFFSAANNKGSVLASVPIFGIGTGPEFVFGPGAQTAIGSGLDSPEGIAVDSAGAIYIPDTGLQQVFKVVPSGKQTTVGKGYQVPHGVAVDGAGNVYVADNQAAAVFKVTPGGVQTKIGSGFSFPVSVAADGEGDVYVSDPFIPTVFKVTPAGTQTQVGSGYNTPAGIALDAAGNLYVADTFSAVVFKVTPGGTQTTVGTGLVSPAAVATDGAGDVYITDDGSNSIIEVTPGGVQSTIVQGLNNPDGVALDGHGNLYVANTFSTQVLKIDRADGPSVAFAATKINHTTDSPKSVQVQNIGNANLNVLKTVFPADFSQAGGDTCTKGAAVVPGGNCVLEIDFSPVTPLGGKPSVVLTEAVALITNNLNVPTKEQVSVSGKELP